MKKKYTFYIIALITLINLSSLGTIIYLKWNSGNSLSMSEIREKRLVVMKEELKLSTEQVKQFGMFMKEFHFRLDTLDARFNSLRNEMLFEIWQTPTTDTQKLENILQQFSTLQLETQRWIVQHFYKFKEVLTPEQIEKFYKIVSVQFPMQQKKHGLGGMVE
jgi:Spy/CpxP family protein refolding chaperone